MYSVRAEALIFIFSSIVMSLYQSASINDFLKADVLAFEVFLNFPAGKLSNDPPPPPVSVEILLEGYLFQYSRVQLKFYLSSNLEAYGRFDQQNKSIPPFITSSYLLDS